MNTWLSEDKNGLPGDKLACRFTNGVSSRWKIYRSLVQEGRQFLHIVHTCEEPASIFPELFSSSTFDMATQPSFWKDELATDQTRLFTDSIAD